MKTYRINKNAARLAQGTGFAPELIYNISLVRFQGRNGRCIAAWTPGMKRPPHPGRIRQGYGAYPAGGRALPAP